MRKLCGSSILLLALATCGLHGCDGDDGGPAGPVGPKETDHRKVVSVRNNLFSPRNVDIARGDTVVWFAVNGGHTTTSGPGCAADGLWDSGLMNAGESFTVVFGSAGVDTVGVIPYFCIPHCAANMTGTVTISP